jgi:phosphoribosylformylglycinamidine synthase
LWIIIIIHRESVSRLLPTTETNKRWCESTLQRNHHTHTLYHTFFGKTMTSEGAGVVHYYRKTEPSHSLLPSVKEELRALGLTEDADKITTIETESCFNVSMTTPLSQEQTDRLEWLLSETFEPHNLHLEVSAFQADPAHVITTTTTVEFGPRMTFTSAFSSNAVSICNACNLLPIDRLEKSRRYRFHTDRQTPLSEEAIAIIKSKLHDRMTEQEYATPLITFDHGARPEPVQTVPIMTEGRAALEKINKERGLGFDQHDLDYYTHLFKVSTHRHYY